MKKIIYFLGLFLVLAVALPNTGMAQVKHLTRKEQRKLEKQKRKEERQKKDAVSRKFYAHLIQSKNFVFQATRLYGPDGSFFSVSPTLNFVAIKNNEIVLQFAFQGVIGWNGVGGITAEGFLKGFKFNPGKNSHQAMTVSSRIQPKGPGGSPYFTMTVGDDGSTEISVTLENGQMIRMGGQLYSPSQASVYKGQTLP